MAFSDWVRHSISILFCEVSSDRKITDVIVFEKLRFCEGLVRTVGLTVEIKLCFQISPTEDGWEHNHLDS